VVKSTIYFDFGDDYPTEMSSVQGSCLWKLSSRYYIYLLFKLKIEEFELSEENCWFL